PSKIVRHPPDRGGELAVAIERCIEAAVTVVAHQRKVVVAIAGKQDLAVWMQSDALPVSVIPDRGGELAVAVEGRIEAAVTVVAHQRKVVVAIAGHQDLAVGLQRDALPVSVIPDRGGELAVAVEGRIEAAVTVVAHQRKVEEVVEA